MIKDFIEFLDNAHSMYHVVSNTQEKLEEAGYQELPLTKKWNLKTRGKYYLIVNDSTIIAFVVGKDPKAGFKIVGAHTDSPSFKVKPASLMKKEGFLTLNTEVYGGPLLNTWFDRPLTLAGRVFIKSDDSFKPEKKLVYLDKDLLSIVSLAIHLSGNIDPKPNPQKHTLPIIGLDQKTSIEALLANELGVQSEDILSYDLFLESREKATLVGVEQEFISSKKLDNLGMVHAGLMALLNSEVKEQTNVFVAFDNEEIGSSTQQGAASSLFRDVLKKINDSIGLSDDEFISSIYNSFMISADQAHSVHPNYVEVMDPTNKPVINKGPVIKESARKSYATDGYGIAVLRGIGQAHNIPIQRYVNRSDIRGGSTIGAIIETNTGIRNIDIGNAILGMHSVREFGGVKDHQHMIDLMKEFFNCSNKQSI